MAFRLTIRFAACALASIRTNACTVFSPGPTRSVSAVGEIVAVDGKTLRRSLDRAASKAAIHRVSAWAKTHRLVLGQLKVEDKSNEITAIPQL